MDIVFNIYCVLACVNKVTHRLASYLVDDGLVDDVGESAERMVR